jgi:small subunit ribosomal protein S19e
MTHPQEIPPNVLLPLLAAELRKEEAIRPPDWALFAKTGTHKDRAPGTKDWWYLRSASILRKLQVRGPSGVVRVADEYGGKKDYGSAPYHARSGSRSIAREILQQLEKAGLVSTIRLRGRALSGKGQSLLMKVSRVAFEQLVQRDPLLKKYA